MVYISNHDDPSTLIHDALTFNHQKKGYKPKKKKIYTEQIIALMYNVTRP